MNVVNEPNSPIKLHSEILALQGDTKKRWQWSASHTKVFDTTFHIIVFDKSVFDFKNLK